LFLCFILLVSLCNLYGQSLTYKQRIEKVVIPFEYHNNFIVITVNVQGLPLKFIVDTGAEHTIMLKKEISDLLGMQYDRKVRIMGADLTSQIFAFVSQNIELKLENKISIRTDLLILEEDFIELDKLVGVNIFGILGSNILKNFIVEFNYQQLKLTLHPIPQFRGPGRRFESMPLFIQKGKPYIDSQLVTADKSESIVRLLLDTGASLSVLYYSSPKNSINIPEKFVTGNLGIGLGGNLKGYVGKVQSMGFGPYAFNDLLANYQKLEESDSFMINQTRDGIIGNVLLSRFTLILDYRKEILYFKPNKLYKKNIKYDRSGLILINAGLFLDEISILDVLSGTPAEEAGLLAGDRILSIGGIPVKIYSFDKVTNKLTAKVGKKIRLKVLRGEEKLKFEFVLRDLL
jgi:predicted aspartyl protease